MVDWWYRIVGEGGCEQGDGIIMCMVRLVVVVDDVVVVIGA